MSDEHQPIEIISILIGFSYTSLNKIWNEDLPVEISSALLDVYRIYEMVSKKKTSQLIYVLTDIKSVSDEVTREIIVNKVSYNIVHFLPSDNLDVKKEIDPSIRWMTIHSRKDMDKALSKMKLAAKRIFVYYTGHGVRGSEKSENSIRLPSSDLYPIAELRDYIVTKSMENAEICFLLDCCHSGDMDMPFRYDEKRDTFTLHDRQNISKKKFATQNILVISSSEVGQRSVAGKGGSYFTKFFIKSVEDTVSLSAIVDYITRNMKTFGHANTMNIFSTYPMVPIIWSWIVNKKRDVYIHDSLSCVVLMKYGEDEDDS